VKREGKRTWHEMEPDAFENFSSREFLEDILPRLKFSVDQPEVLEYGCGTGPGACFLAQRGFCVEGVDLIPTAVEIAKKNAYELGLDISFGVQDMCELPHRGKKYDMIVDSFCLQSFVTDEDREKVFAAVRARLKPEGYYLISSAMWAAHRDHAEDVVVDSKTGRRFTRYDDEDLFDPETEQFYDHFGRPEHDDRPEDYDGTFEVNGVWYIPKRRYRKPETLWAEVESHGFRVLAQSGEYGENIVCVHKGSSVAFKDCD